MLRCVSYAFLITLLSFAMPSFAQATPTQQKANARLLSLWIGKKAFPNADNLTLPAVRKALAQGVISLPSEPSLLPASPSPPTSTRTSVAQHQADARLVSLWSNAQGAYDEHKGDLLTLTPVQQAVSRGADINVRDKQGDTALKAASDFGHEDVVALLLAHGASGLRDGWKNQVLKVTLGLVIGAIVIYLLRSRVRARQRIVGQLR